MQDGQKLAKTERTVTATTKLFRQNIAISVEESPQTSTINMALSHGIRRRSVRKILESIVSIRNNWFKSFETMIMIDG